MKNKKGISLVVLIITIIVMIILAGTVVLTLNNTGIVKKAQEAVDQTNLNEVQSLASIKWAEAFLEGKTKRNDLETAVLSGLVKEGIDITLYRISVTDEGVQVALRPQSTGNWIVDRVDGVPIPKGFVASSATGENTKLGGLVIYQGTEAVTDANVDEARTTRNQYVWIPIEDFSKFVRQGFGAAASKVSNELGTVDNFWEIKLDSKNMPLTIQDTEFVTPTTLMEVQEMYESVKANRGFYIARYETGIDNQRKSDNGVLEASVYSVMGKIPYTYVPWTKNNTFAEDTNGAVQVARSMYPDTADYGVVSTLTYGVQWDSILKWWLDTNKITSATNAIDYGNFNNHVITSQDELNTGALVWDFTTNEQGEYVSKESASLTYPKVSGTYWALSTGALKAGKVANVYDMYGNVWEWTMEGYSNLKRTYRGGSFHSDGSISAYPRVFTCGPSDGFNRVGLRVALYIKK